MRKYLILGLGIAMILSFGVILAQETEIAAEDLDVEEPGPFSWLGDIARDVQIFFTFDPIKKSELELKKASRQLIRARNTVRENPDDTKLQARLEKFDEKYQELVERINARVENFKTENPEAPELKNFLDKYTDHQLLHQQVLKRLEEQVSVEVMGMIRERREEHLERFGEVMNQLQNKEELKERLKAGLENSQRAIEQRVLQVEILDELEEAVPVIKEGIRELKQESKELFQELEIKRQQIRQKIQPIEGKTSEAAGESQQLRQEIRQEQGEMLGENIQAREEAREERQGFIETVKNRFREMFRKKTSEEDIGCLQVITPAEDPRTGQCQEFPTPCDVPKGWQPVDSCQLLKDK